MGLGGCVLLFLPAYPRAVFPLLMVSRQAGEQPKQSRAQGRTAHPARHKTTGCRSFPGRAELPGGGGHSGPVQALATPAVGPTSCAPSPPVLG